MKQILSRELQARLGRLSVVAALIVHIARLDVSAITYWVGAALFTLSGVHLIASGLLGELCARIYLESGSRPAYEVRDLVNFEHDTLDTVEPPAKSQAA